MASVIRWGIRINAREASRINKLIYKAGKNTKQNLETVVLSISDSLCNPFHDTELILSQIHSVLPS